MFRVALRFKLETAFKLELKFTCELAGKYLLGNCNDKTVVEELVKTAKEFILFSFQNPECVAEIYDQGRKPRSKL